MGQDTFREVLVTQAIRPTDADGDMGVDPNDLMPPSYHLETIAEKRFGGRLDRISQIVSIDPAPDLGRKPDQGPSAPSALRTLGVLPVSAGPAVASLTSCAVSR